MPIGHCGEGWAAFPAREGNDLWKEQLNVIVNLIEPAFPVPQMTQDIVGRDGLAVIGSDGSKSQIVIEVPLFETETRKYCETRFATETRNHEPEPLNLEHETRNSKREGLPVIGSDGSKS